MVGGEVDGGGGGSEAGGADSLPGPAAGGAERACVC